MADLDNKEKVITEMLHKLNLSGCTAKECIEVSDEWLRNNPRHASNNGIINGWEDEERLYEIYVNVICVFINVYNICSLYDF